MWMHVANMPSTLQVVSVLVADWPGKLSWVQLSQSVSDAFGISEIIGSDFFMWILLLLYWLIKLYSITSVFMPVGGWHRHPCINIDMWLLYCIPEFNLIQNGRWWKSCYDQEVEEQSSPDNNSKLMDTIKGIPLYLWQGSCKYKDQRIKKNAWQEITKSLKAPHVQ